jgi:hypothetical protein
MSLTSFFAICVVALIAAVAALGIACYIMFSDKAKLQRQVDELHRHQTEIEVAKKSAESQTSLTLAQNRQQDVIQVARNATNVLGPLLLVVNRIKGDMEALRTNSAGRSIALHPELVAQARRFFEDDAKNVPSSDEVLEKLESARRVEQQLLAVAGTAYEPEASVTASAQDALVWGESQKRNVNQAAATLANLQREAKVKVTATPLGDALTLDDAMAEIAAAEANARGQTILKHTSQAQIDAVELEAKGKSAKILADAESKKTDSDLEAQKLSNATQKKVLLDKAARPDIQRQLAAFLTPGYFSPNVQTQVTYEKKPMSYSMLKEAGALQPSMDGLRIFARIATNQRNDRPRLPKEFQYAWWSNSDLVDQIKKLQQLMIELGPTFVDTGVMQP